MCTTNAGQDAKKKRALTSIKDYYADADEQSRAGGTRKDLKQPQVQGH